MTNLILIYADMFNITQKPYLDVVELPDDPIRTCVSCQVTIHGLCNPYAYEAGLVTVDEGDGRRERRGWFS